MKINLRKSKVSYTIMIVSDSADRAPKTYHIKAGWASVTGILTFLLFTALICFVVYNSVIAASALNRIQTQQEKMDKLQESYENLKGVNSTLEEAYAKEALAKEALEKEISSLSETLNTKEEEAQLLEAEEEQKHIPTRFPLDAVAGMKEETGGRQTGMTAKEEWKEVIFTAAEGASVIATASGTVISIAPDEHFGTLIQIDHGNGYITTYRNNGEPIIKEDNKVEAGTVLFVIRNNNTETGYSIRKDNTYVDPMDLLDIKG